MSTYKPILAALTIAAALAIAACGAEKPAPATAVPAAQASAALQTTGSVCGTDDGKGCAPDSARVDLARPAFSHPLTFTNPLFPAGTVTQTILLGKVGGEPFRVEYTLLPGSKRITLDGQAVETVVVQYAAYLDRRVHELALDFYAQADDGSVWYFGEDVFNYEDGVVADTHGTWLAGRDGPAAMIMPAAPSVGGVYRPENIPGLVFEEVVVKSIGATYAGPRGPISGAVVVGEVHMDGSTEEKVFAPGYGEFLTGSGADIEAVALAVPTDALSGPEPAAVSALVEGASQLFGAAGTGEWGLAGPALASVSTAWKSLREAGTPPLLELEMKAALLVLTSAVNARDAQAARQAALDVAQTGLDLALRHRTPAEIDLDRLALWAAQLTLDAAAGDAAGVTSDVVIMEVIRDRVGHTFSSTDGSGINALLAELRVAADSSDLGAAADAATRLRAALSEL